MRMLASGMLLAATLLGSGCVVADADDGRYARSYPSYGYGNDYGSSSIYRGSAHDYQGERYSHPTPGVTCDRYNRVCYDRQGPELSVTREHFGRDAAKRLEDQIGGNWKRDDIYTPKKGVKCDVDDEVCRKRGEENYLHTRQQFGRREAEQVRNKDGNIRVNKKVVCDPQTEVCFKNGETSVNQTRFVFGNRAARDLKRDKKD